MKVGIDIDGVLTNLERFQIDYGSFYCYQHQIEEELNPKSYQLFKRKPERIMEFWEEYLEKYSLEEPMRPFANDIIQKMKKKEWDKRRERRGKLLLFHCILKYEMI